VSIRSSALRTTVAAVAAISMGAVAFTPAAVGPASTSLTSSALEALPIIDEEKRAELGADWFETFLDTADGERLYATVMVPTGTDLTDDDVNLPVVAVVSPYLGYESFTGHGPSDRFLDLIEGAELIKNGYAVVQVSTRGSGGSSGCLDILGPGEQLDTVTAVEWAASQPWSNGRVGLYGKSYDGNTGAFAVANQPVGLAAVVAQAIAPDRYRGSYGDKARLVQSIAYPGVSYGAGGEASYSSDAPIEYNTNSAARAADCQALLAEHYVPEESLDFWRIRDAVDRVGINGSDVPTFVTAGYADTNTNIGAGAAEFFQQLKGDGHHLWIGWWDHVRGNDVESDGSLAMGRDGFFDAVMGFYDENLKGIVGADREVTVAAQSNDGSWREEASYPSDDAVPLRIDLKSGSYTDDGVGRGSNDSSIGAGGVVNTGTAGEGGIWSITPPLVQDLHIAGVPSALLWLSGVPGANVAVNVYDIAPDGTALFLTRGVGNVDVSVTAGPAGYETVALFATDGIVRAGHRIGVFVQDVNTEAFIHTPTGTDVTVISGVVRLQAVAIDRGNELRGVTNNTLESFRTTAEFDASSHVTAANEVSTFVAPRFR
jgi:predicted acyl esterase